MNNAARNHQFITRQHKPFDAVSATTMDVKYRKRCFREGKTERDHKNGNPQRNAARKAARGAWCNDSKANPALFPI